MRRILSETCTRVEEKSDEPQSVYSKVFKAFHWHSASLHSYGLDVWMSPRAQALPTLSLLVATMGDSFFLELLTRVWGRSHFRSQSPDRCPRLRLSLFTRVWRLRGVTYVRDFRARWSRTERTGRRDNHPEYVHARPLWRDGNLSCDRSSRDTTHTVTPTANAAKARGSNARRTTEPLPTTASVCTRTPVHLYGFRAPSEPLRNSRIQKASPHSSSQDVQPALPTLRLPRAC